ncbi:MAG TPA: hypothetical protein DEO84_10080 [candidate division Zixibacteria bacterium]|nr:hypothetical protein [candidate division Zixibacteria bacterium]HBZ01653.1 hypothetical protein [candidate division Zixibacteria bacterium]
MKETLINIKAIIPLMDITDLELEDETKASSMLELSDRAISELIQMSNYLTIDFSENIGESPVIEIKELLPSEIEENVTLPNEGTFKSRILQFSFKKQYDPAAVEAQFDSDGLSTLGRSGIIGLTNDIMADELSKKIINLFLAANIAKPGSIGFESGMIYTNGQFNTELGYFSCDYLDREDYEVESIIRLRELPIKGVWDWFDSIEGTEVNSAIGSVGRAIGALSYIFGPGSSHLWPQIIWSLLGLEAVYAPKRQLQKYQLTANIPKLLGKKAVAEELIEQLYELRLQFIHGDADFPFAHNDFNEIYGLDDDKFYEAQHYALALLMATLQELSERGLTESPFTESE